MKITLLSRHALTVALVGTLFFGTYASAFSQQQPPNPIPPGKPAPNFSSKNNGWAKNLSEIGRGKVVVLDFWATWCGPCMAVVPTIEGLHKEFEPQGLRVIGMSLDESDSINDIKPFIQRFHMTYPVVTGPNGNRILAQRYQVSVPPVIYVIDKKGKVRFSQLGIQTEPGADKRDLTAIIKKLLAEPA